ncbi:hypothetical protein PR002_g27821, partial [Phytophthora rubi]
RRGAIHERRRVPSAALHVQPVGSANLAPQDTVALCEGSLKPPQLLSASAAAYFGADDENEDVQRYRPAAQPVEPSQEQRPANGCNESDRSPPKGAV